jgi:hypothetical protein
LCLVVGDCKGGQLQQHLRKVRALHQTDLAEGYGRVELPHALARMYPNAFVEWDAPGCAGERHP